MITFNDRPKCIDDEQCIYMNKVMDEWAKDNNFIIDIEIKAEIHNGSKEKLLEFIWFYYKKSDLQINVDHPALFISMEIVKFPDNDKKLAIVLKHNVLDKIKEYEEKCKQ